LDFDGSVVSIKGHAEGTAVGFNKRKKGNPNNFALINLKFYATLGFGLENI